MVQPAGKTVIAIVLALLLGMQWTVLQSAAWVGMIISYSQDSSFSEAFTKTFDGQHPCRLCKLVSEGKRSEKAKEAANPGQRIEATASESQLVLWYPEVLKPSPARWRLPESTTFPPPHQPPRV